MPSHLTLVCNSSRKGGHLAKRNLNFFTRLSSCNGLVTSPTITQIACVCCHEVFPSIKAHVHTLEAHLGYTHLGPIKIGLSFYTWKCCFYALRDWHARRYSISPIDIEAQTKNPKKRNSPLNTCVGGIRLEGCMLYFNCIFDLIPVTCCIACASCIHALHIAEASY